MARAKRMRLLAAELAARTNFASMVQMRGRPLRVAAQGQPYRWEYPSPVYRRGACGKSRQGFRL
jgi:hypothetical protein